MKDEHKLEQEDTKLLGSQVPENIYWLFKNAAAQRKETMRDAIINAALLYISIEEEEK